MNTKQTDTLNKSVISEEEQEQLFSFDFVRFSLADINGVPRGKNIPRESLNLMTSGGGRIYCGTLVYGPSSEIPNIPDISEAHFCNSVLQPMPGTLRHLPWAGGGKYKIGHMICEISWPSHLYDGRPMEPCPRFMARKQIGLLGELGYELKSSFEAEFFVFSLETGLGMFSGVDCFGERVAWECESLLCDIATNLRKIGVGVEAFNAEYGPGQFEYSLIPQFGIDMPDAMYRLKNTIKELCFLRGLEATFMPKPNLAHTGVGLHLNHSLWTKDHKTNLFYDEESKDRLSKVAKHWLAGLLHHSPALTAIFCPTVNAYRRLHKPWAPHRVDWAIDDRIVTYRVKNYSQSSTYIENRLCSGEVNPYLAIAATIAAGLNGIRNKLELPEEKDEPKILAGSLEEALLALKQDEVMVEALGSQFVDWFCAMKEQSEIEQLRGEGIEAERLKYKDNL